MAIIPQRQLFGWKEFDELGDLQRLLPVLNYLPDEELMKNLEQERGKGRDDYPKTAVPPSYVYSRFCRKLMGCQEEVNKMFFCLVGEIKALLPDFGRVLAIDSKTINSLARGPKDKKDGVHCPDGRRESDADFGKKEYRGQRKNGTMWKKCFLVWL